MVTDSCPWVTEIGYPRNIKLFFQLFPDEVQAMRWPGCDNYIYGIDFDIFRKILNRRFYPADSCVRNKKITSDEQPKLFGSTLIFLVVNNPRTNILCRFF